MALNPQFDHVFQFLPYPSLILLPDAPKFTIVAVNDAYLEAVNSVESDLIGKGIFEAFPENPEDSISKGVENLKNSLNLVIAQKELHKMPLQKYDIPIRGTSKFKVKYANVRNIPLKDDIGNLTHILHSIEDVTDKKQLQITLENEKQLFQDLYLQAPSFMGILKGPDHVYELANPLYLELIGVNDVIGKTVKEVLPELEAQGILQLLDTVYESGEIFTANEMLVKFDHHRNGELVDTYLNFIYRANRNNDGTIDGILFFGSDVTELVQSRKKIEESEARYKELIENLPVATYSCDLEGRILLYNKAAATLWGREPELGKDKWGGSWKIYSDNGKPIPIDMCPMAIGIKEGRKIIDQELIVERPNGDKKNVLSYPVTLMDSSGGVTEVVNVLIDITERKKAELQLIQSEKRLKQAQEIAQLGSWELNFETGISLWSDETCKIFGLSPKDNKRTYASWLSFIHPEDVGAISKLFEEANKTLSDLILTYRIILKDGTIKYIYEITKFEFDSNQKPIGLYGISMDITERKKEDEKLEKLNKELAYQNEENKKRAEELNLANLELEFQNREKENRTVELYRANVELYRTNKELVKTNKELDRFVYSVSHDLRSPLTSILGLVSFIEEDSKEPDTLDQVKMIKSSIHRLDGFIKNILNYSKNNRTGLETKKIPLKKTIYEIVDSVRNIKEANGISFKIDIDEKHPFYSDWHRFNTVVENLVSNAIKYHSQEVAGRYLKVACTSDRDELNLSISDNGIGIDPEFHDKIFEMFYRLPGNTDGSGIGLYIVKETVEKMRGTIEIESKKGVGTTFNIKLKNLKHNGNTVQLHG